MKLRTPCVPCLNIDDLYSIDLTNEPYIEFKCKKGHLNALALQSEKFELFLMHGLAYYNNNQRMEAIFKLNLALEEFHKFCIKIFLRKQDIDSCILEGIHKSIFKRSEQINGAFHILFLFVFNQLPDGFMKNNAHLRNEIIHNGHFPTNEETESYARSAYDYIRSILKELKKTHQKYIWEHIVERTKKAGKPGLISNITPLLYEIDEDSKDFNFENMTKLASQRLI